MVSEGFRSVHQMYRSMISRKILFFVLCVAIIFTMVVLSVTIGEYNIGFVEAYRVIIDVIIGRPVDFNDYHVIWEIRMPRALLAVLVGVGLAAAGAVMQTMMRNPLADPYTTGISAGASLGATVAIVYGFCIIPGLNGGLATIVDAFVFSLAPVGMIILLSKYRTMTPTTMILSGMAVMFIFSAATSMIRLMSSPNALAQTYRWSVGTLGTASWSVLPPVLLAVVFGCVSLMLYAGRLNILSVGDRGAGSLGVNPVRTRIVCLLIVSLMTAVIVSYTGPIGFVGLVSPHVVRMFINSDNRYLIPCSAAFGAVMVLLADSVSKMISSVNLPVGVVTALIGGPIFVYLLIRMNKSTWNGAR